MRYRADITAGSLKVAESRVIADLLLKQADDDAWKSALGRDNLLQARSPATARRLSRMIRNRLETMTPDLWKLVRDGNSTAATHACLAAAVKHSVLLADFLELVVKDQYRIFADKLNRVCDHHPVGRSTEGAMTFSVISPLDDDFEQNSDQKCILSSSADDGQAIVRLDDEKALGRELRTYLRTEKYIRTKDDSTSPPTTRRIHKDVATENQQRRNLLANMLSDMLVEASYFVAGEKLEINANAPISAMEEALEYLVENTFTKLSYLKHLNDNPNKEIQAILKSDDTTQQVLQMALPENNPQALDEVRSYLNLASKRDREIILYDTCFGRFSDRPCGWPEQETALLLTRLYANGEILFMRSGDAIKHDDLYSALSESKNWRKITIVQKVTAKVEDVKTAREIGKEVFHQMGPETEEGLFDFLRNKLSVQQASLKRYAEFASSGDYPGEQTIDACLATIKPLLAVEESNKFLERFNDNKSSLLDLSDDFHDLEHFYESQKPTWDKLLKAEQRFSLNRRQLQQDDEARRAMERIQAIRKAANPYSMVHEVDPLVSTIEKVNDKLITEQRARSLQQIDAQIGAIQQELEAVSGDSALSSSCLRPLESLKSQVTGQNSLAHITQAEADAISLKDSAISKIGQFVAQREAAKATQVAEKEPGGGDSEDDTPKFKPPRVIHPKALVSKTYLEDMDDVEQFLKAMRTQLETAISNNERIEIR